ncbi:MAG TPA: sugar transporter [Desulfovibrio sp.]|nr:sugar transporter [Desulfovibrio sp.]
MLFALSPDEASAQLTVNDEYRLGPEDIVEISVWGDEQLAREVVVRPDGGISFPLAGDMMAGGLTVNELRAKLKERIAEYIPDAPVTVILRKVEAPKVYVMGKVNNPKVHVMGQDMTVVQALAMSGGLSPFAESGNIIIVRREKDGTQKVYRFDYDELAEGENLKQNILLKSGDTVIVP